jgi:hypothetical protein
VTEADPTKIAAALEDTVSAAVKDLEQFRALNAGRHH